MKCIGIVTQKDRAAPGNRAVQSTASSGPIILIDMGVFRFAVVFC